MDRLARRPPCPPGDVGACFVLAGGLLWRILGVLLTSPTAVVNMPLPDDAYYYFTLARNIALGNGAVISGDGSVTTGFQPLWGFLLAGLQWLLGNPAPRMQIFMAQLVGALFGIVSSWLLYRLVRAIHPSQGLALVALAGYTLSPQIIRHQLNGLETSLALMAVITILWFFVAFRGRWITPVQALAVGIVAGLGFLARSDTLLVAVPGIALYFLSIARDCPRNCWSRLVATVAACALGGLVALLPWLAFAGSSGFGVVPESGEAIRVITVAMRHLPIDPPIASVVRAPSLFLPLYARNLLEFSAAWLRQVPTLFPFTIPLYALAGTETAVEFSGVAAFVIAALVLVMLLRSHNRPMAWLAVLWCIYAGMMAGAYTVFIQGPWFFIRYAAPLGAVFNVLALLALFELRPVKLHHALSLWIATLALAGGFASLLVGGSYRWLVAGRSTVPEDGWYQATEYMNTHLAAGTRVGSFSAGLIGYYGELPVIPLDGKVNRRARLAIVSGEMSSYICEVGIGYVVDWRKTVASLLVRRSRQWDDRLLTEVHVIPAPEQSDIVFYRVNPAYCPAPQTGASPQPAAP